MKTSCINHPPNNPLVLIRAWQVEACEGDHCAAALLSFFEYWHNIKLAQQGQAEKMNAVAAVHGEPDTQETSLLQYHKKDELEDGLLHLYSKRSIDKSIDLLIRKEFVSIHQNPNPRYCFDKTRYFLFHPDRVNLYLSTNVDETQLRGRSGKFASSTAQNGHDGDANLRDGQPLFASSFSEISSETSAENSPPLIPPQGEDTPDGAVAGGTEDAAAPEASAPLPLAPPTTALVAPLTRAVPLMFDAPQGQAAIDACGICNSSGYLTYDDEHGRVQYAPCSHDRARIEAKALAKGWSVLVLRTNERLGGSPARDP